MKNLMRKATVGCSDEKKSGAGANVCGKSDAQTDARTDAHRGNLMRKARTQIITPSCTKDPWLRIYGASVWALKAVLEGPPPHHDAWNIVVNSKWTRAR